MNKLIFILIIMISATLSAQQEREWKRRYNGPVNGDDNARSMTIDGYGNIYVCGSSLGDSGKANFVIIKYDRNGDTVWVSRQGITEYGGKITVDKLSNVYITGKTGEGISTIKLDSSGSFKWKRDYTEENLIGIYVAAISNDRFGNIFVLGSLFAFPFVNNSGYFLIKYDQDGTIVWLRKYVNDTGGDPSAMAIDGAGNIYVTGYMYFSNDDFLTVKYNNDGDSLWVRSFNTPGYYDHSSAIAVDSAGNVYVTGDSGGSPFVYFLYKYLTIKYNANGDQLWYRRYDGLGNDWDHPTAICTDNTGNVYVTGESSGQGNNSDYATVKYNSSGDSVWVRRYNGPANSDDKAASMCIDREGNIYVTGFSGTSRNQNDYCTIKYSSSGAVKWILNYDGPAHGSDEAVSITNDHNGNVYVTGTSAGIKGGNDFLTIKYPFLLTDVNSGPIKTSSSYYLYQNYPNPFNPVTNLEFQILNFGFVSLKVYDIQGKETATLVNDKLSPGTYSYEFDGSNLSSGVYIYKLVTGEFSDTKRMILIK